MLSWAEAEGAAVVPFGGGTSVVGGVEPRLGERPVVTLDLRRLDRVLEVDPVSLAARIQAGATGPRLEEQLREHGLTLRHFPQSFEYSTLGGWIATRAGGHFATLETHIDDLVESVRAITPRGTWESRRLPGSGAGPSPDRLLLGSEGILGVDHRGLGAGAAAARFKASCAVEFDDFLAGGAGRCGRSPSRACTRPTAGCSTRVEAALTGAGTARPTCSCSASSRPTHPVDAASTRRRSRSPASHGGTPGEPRSTGRTTHAAESSRGGEGGATARSSPGAARSCWRPTCATPSSPAGCSRRPSRRRSPGTASRSSTRR